MGDSGSWFKNVTGALTHGITDPAGYTIRQAGNVFGGFFQELTKYDPVGNIIEAANMNTYDVIKGDTEFGVHDDWVGGGALGDFVNPIMGGKTQAQMEDEEFNEAIRKAQLASKKKKAPKAQEDFTKSLVDEDDDTVGRTLLT
jgi:hypothetical protein